MTTYATDWRAAGACLSADPELFFPIPQGAIADRQIRNALRVCAGCAVRQQCLAYAMADAEIAGVWGGTTERERRKLRSAA